MLNFDLKKSKIYQAIKWQRFFIGAKVFKIIFSCLFIFSGSLFLIGAATKREFSFLAGFSLIFFSLFLFFWLAQRFYSKLKKPKIRPSENLANFLSFEVAKAINSALKYASKKKIFPLNSSLLFYFLIKQEKKLNFLFLRLLIDKRAFLRILKEKIFLKEKLGFGVYSQSFQETLLEAKRISQSKNRQRIGIGDIFVALSKNEPAFKQVLIDINLKPEDVKNLVLWWERERERKQRNFFDYENLIRWGSIAKDWACGYTITLDKYAIDWSKIAKMMAFERIIGYQEELSQIERILASPEINNVLMIGEPGVGMKNIIYLLSVRSVLGRTIPEIRYKRIVELNLPALLSSLKSLDEVEDILNKIFQEVIRAGNVILVIDNFHNFVFGKTRPGAIDITGVLSSYLGLPQFRLVAITSYAGLHKNIEQRPAILNLFSKVEVKEPTKEETLLILEDKVRELEGKYKRYLSYQALKEIVDLAENYILATPFPKKAQDLLNEVMVQVSRGPKSWVTPEDVDEIVTQKTEIPVGKLAKKEKEILLNLEKEIHKRIINQNEAVGEVSSALRRARAKIETRKAPMGSFLFLGPTGVGKTETSKALAEIYFGSEERMIRLDMSEFQAIEDIPRLIGSPGQEGLLTTAVRERPFSLILLDEIEKAHPNILNLFLQVLDEGHITDGLGRRVDFRNTIIIATSNAGYKVILKALKEKIDFSKIKGKLLDYLFQEGIFRPEFINRFDAVVIFRPLTKENLLDIAQLMLQKVKKNLEKKNIEFVITQPLKEKIVELSYDIKFGARNMQRVIQDKVEDALAEAILREEIKRGDRISVDPTTFRVIKQER
jgi:ATP-dependent Clp protease ATP-binding subunit ClpC